MSSQTQTQLAHVHDIAPRIRHDGKVVCNHDIELPLLTSRTGNNPGRQFFSCVYRRGDTNRCGFFYWLDDIRKTADWDEALFRQAYPYEDSSTNLAETPRKRRASPGPSFGSSDSPKRVRHTQSDEEQEFFASPPSSTTLTAKGSTSGSPSTPSNLSPQSLGLPSGTRPSERHNEWPLTPQSSSSHLGGSNAPVEIPPSPSREAFRRRENRVIGSQPLHLQNFDNASDLSPLSSTSHTQHSQPPPPVASESPSAEQLENMLRAMSTLPAHIQRLERKLVANQGTLSGRNTRIYQLEEELESIKQENNKLIRENERLTSENNRLTQSLRGSHATLREAF